MSGPVLALLSALFRLQFVTSGPTYCLLPEHVESSSSLYGSSYCWSWCCTRWLWSEDVLDTLAPIITNSDAMIEVAAVSLGQICTGTYNRTLHLIQKLMGRLTPALKYRSQISLGLGLASYSLVGAKRRRSAES